MAVLHCFRMRPEILSGPGDLDGSRFQRWWATSSSEMEISDNKTEVSKERGASLISVDCVGQKTEQK